MKNRLLYILLFTIGGILIWYFYTKYRVAPEMDFFSTEVYDENGNRIDLQQYRGKKLIVTYYASWCGECLQEMKMLNEIKDIKLADAAVIAITDEPAETMVSFRDRKKYPFDFYRINKPFSEIGVNAIPVNYLINSNGKVVWTKVGAADWDDNNFVRKAKQMME